jgi:hypothetical protein
MRTVGRFQLVAVDVDGERFSQTKKILQDWIDLKYLPDGQGWKIRKTNEPAQLEVSEVEDGSSYFKELRTQEYSGAAEFHTITRLLHADAKTYFENEIRAGGSDDLISTTRLTVKSPAFFKDVVQKLPGWHYRIGSDKVFAQAFNVDETNAPNLLELLIDPNRRLPIVAVSKMLDGELVQNLSLRISHALCGLSHVCVLDELASWYITNELGPEWSCFNKAIRVYWPRTVLNSSPFRHRLWLPDHFKSVSFEEANADWKIANRVAEQIVAASAFAPRFSEIAIWEAKRDRKKFEAELTKIKSDEDYDKLERTYAQENDRLTALVAALQDEVRRLQVPLIQSRLESDVLDSVGSTEDLEDLRTVLATWMNKSDSRLIFSDQILEQFESINPHGCPPDKLNRHFEVLSELAHEMHGNKGALGKTIVKWIKDRGIEASNESDTKKGSGLFRFPIAGKPMEFELHMKVTDRTSPDRCVRVYFEPSKDNTSILVGFVGSKNGL